MMRWTDMNLRTVLTVAAFAVLILILLFRPGGLLGKSTIEKV